MAEDTRAGTESHFVSRLDYVRTIPSCGGKIVWKNAFETVS